MTAASLPLFYVRPRVLQPALHGRHSLVDQMFVA
ncbi:MAG: hypothetical protein JWP52_4327 [Rhizobacter sp.]|nr:hypothetical protein [Rhizobacter sp.]